MKRRSFFQSLAKAAAIIALAPQLAFRSPPQYFGVKEQLAACESLINREPFSFPEFLALCRSVQEELKRQGSCDTIDVYIHRSAIA